jgi:hypothetical protein
VTLARYFQTMIWLGRIDFRMGGGSHAEGSLRQLCAAAPLSLLLEQSGQLDPWKAIEETINAFVGFADFMTPEQMLKVLETEDLTPLIRFQATLVTGLRQIVNVWRLAVEFVERECQLMSRSASIARSQSLQ